MVIKRGSRTLHTIVEANTTHFVDLGPFEFLAGYKTSMEGVEFIRIQETTGRDNCNTIEVTNTDPDWKRFIILFIRSESKED